MLRRPAFRRSVLRAGAETHDRRIGAQAEPIEERAARRRGSLARRGVGNGSRQRGIRVQGERTEPLDHSRQSGGIELARVVEQPVAEFADPAGATRDAGEPRHQRRLPRVRQDDRLVVAARREFTREPPSRARARSRRVGTGSRGPRSLPACAPRAAAPTPGASTSISADGLRALSSVSIGWVITMSPTQLGATTRMRSGIAGAARRIRRPSARRRAPPERR